MQNALSYIRDSQHFLEKIKTIGSVPENAILVTADVVGLYPNIPHQAGLKALKKALERRDIKKIPTEDLVRMAEFVLNNNIFEFNSQAYQQKSGTAIGTKFAPPYACIYMDGVEQKFLETQSKKPLIWLRYIDDIFFIWTHGEQELERFLKDLNNFTPKLSFTHEASKNCIPFLDLKVKLIDGKLETDLYMKPADCHQYLHYLSSHPEHTKRSIIYSQTLHVNRLCSLEKDFNYHKLNMKERFIKRGYPESVIEKEMQKVHFSKQGQKSKKVEKGVPFVVTYHPLLNKLSSILHRNLYLLYMNQEVKNVFTPGPIVSYRSARKISSYLVRAKLYPLERKVGSVKCGKSRCEVCLSIQETDAFTSTTTGESFKMNHKLNCDNNCLIYLLTCKCCGKQYVGETTDEFRLRWNNYKSNGRKNARNETCMQEHLFEHFKSEDHSGFLGNVSITLIDKTDGKESKRRENYWMRTLKTYAPFGLNIEDSV